MRLTYLNWCCFSWRTEQRNRAGCRRRDPVRPPDPSLRPPAAPSSVLLSHLLLLCTSPPLCFHSAGSDPHFPWCFLQRVTHIWPFFCLLYHVLPTRSPVFVPHVCKKFNLKTNFGFFFSSSVCFASSDTFQIEETQQRRTLLRGFVEVLGRTKGPRLFPPHIWKGKNVSHHPSGLTAGS